MSEIVLLVILSFLLALEQVTAIARQLLPVLGRMEGMAAAHRLVCGP
jgi:hypothetical protein